VTHLILSLYFPGAIDAQLDRVPMLVITGLKELGKISHSDFQDIDQTSLFRSAGLPYSVTIASPHQVFFE
jgi:thiamine pyrophosphate-dependent acetolactate synthase large subunit-like protein